jgi:leucine-rich repeat transmembrane neuronal protein 1/2
VTFKSVDAFAVLPRLQAHDTFSVSFQIKTTESDGLLLYNAGKGQDFFAMELTAGFLYYVYNMGGGGYNFLSCFLPLGQSNVCSFTY